MSEGSTCCKNVLFDQRDLQALRDLDPSQSEGYRSVYRQQVPCTIRLPDEDGDDIVDKQQVVVNILERTRGGDTANVRIQITSEIDLQLNLTFNCTPAQFQDIKTKNQINIKFKDFAGAVAKMLESSRSIKERVAIELTLSREANSILKIVQTTEFKILELLSIPFFQSEPQKVSQSIIFRYNYQKAKLRLIDTSLESIYAILQKKNPSLLQYIKKSVGYL